MGETQKVKNNNIKGCEIAYCGTRCTECPAYIATQTDNYELLVKTAREWSIEFERPCKPEDILCDGCKSNSQRVCKYVNQCQIRRCCRNKKLDNCAFCEQYPCSDLKEFFFHLPDAKYLLDEINRSRSIKNESL